MLPLRCLSPALRLLTWVTSSTTPYALPIVAAAAGPAAVAEVHARTATIDGQKVFYREAGDPKAPVIVLLHGFPSSSHMYRDLIPRLADRFHVVAPDYIGFGHSAAPVPGEYIYTFDNLAKTTQALLDQIGVRDAVYYMQDYGGPIGLRLAAAHPERVKGLVIQNANAYIEGVGKPVADVFLPLWKERNAATEGAARGFLTSETTRFQYTYGARDAAALNPDAWTHDQALLDRKGNDVIQLALFVDYQNNVGLYDAWHAYLREHQPRTLIVWGKGDPLFVPAGAEAYKKDLLTDAQAELNLTLGISLARGFAARSVKRATFSLSRTQLAVWFTFALCAGLFLFVAKGDLPPLDGSLLILLGISVGTASAGQLISADGDGKFRPSRNFIFDLVTGPDDKQQVHRLQAVAVNLLLIVVGFVHIKQQLTYPIFDNTWLYFLGISGTAYAAGKQLTETPK